MTRSPRAGTEKAGMGAFARILLLIALLAGMARAAPLEGDARATLGAYEEADRLYRKALEGAREPSERRLLLSRLLGVAQARNDVSRVEELSTELEAVLQQHPDPEVELRLHLVRGAVYYRTQDLERARAAFTRARAVAGRLKGASAALALYECDSYAYLERLGREGEPGTQEYEKACRAAFSHLTGWEKAELWPLDAMRSLTWDRLWVWQSWEYAYHARRKGDQGLLERWCTLSIGAGIHIASFRENQAQATRNTEYVYASLHDLLEVTFGFPEWPQTTALLDSVHEILTQNPDFSSVEEGTYLWGRYHRSRARWQFFLKHDPARALEEYARAEAFMLRARRPLEEVDVNVEVAYLYFLWDAPPDWAPKVEECLRKALAATERVAYPYGRYFALGFMGTLKARRGDLAGAESDLKAALAQLARWLEESGATPVGRRKMLSRPESELFTEEYVQLLIRQNRVADAVEAARQLEAQSALAGLDLERVKARDPAVARALDEIAEKRQQSRRLEAELQSAQIRGDQAAERQIAAKLADNRADFMKAVNHLRAQDPDFERLVAVRPSTLSKLQSRLPEDTLLVQYFAGAEQLYLFVATREHLKLYSVPSARAELERKVMAARRAISGQAPPNQPLEELYGLLVQPLEAELEGKRVLAVLPSGMLYYLPFAALSKPGQGYLVQRHAVAILTPTEVTELGQGPPPDRPSSLLALGDPDGSLPGARREVEELARLFPSPTTFMGQQATEARVQSPGSASVVHLATHGVLDPHDVNESYLLVADGKLTTGEVYGLDFSQVQLVTLSACSTALAERQPGGEVANLAQAFSVAGSHSMLASLWKVDDEATATLMVEFYRQLSDGKSKAEALRQAQLKVLREPRWSNPACWAAFELIGDWR
ncbi:MAG: CHAT domain-containing protein [Candidatus Eremiobacterota bacterium]